MVANDVFSSTFKKKWKEEPVLVLGGFEWSRQTMVDELHNGHFAAAARVTQVFKKLGIRSIWGIKRIPVMDWARVEGFGEASLSILVDLLYYKGEYSEGDIQVWLSAELKGHRLIQWEALCRQAAKKAWKRGRHAA